MQWIDTPFESYKRRLHEPNLQIQVYNQLLPKEEVQQLQEYASGIYKKMEEEIAAFVEKVKEEFDPRCIFPVGGGAQARELRDKMKSVCGVDCYYGLYGLAPYHYLYKGIANHSL